MSMCLLRKRRKNIRNRRNFIGLWLDDKEYSHLQKQCDLSGLSTSAHIRKIIMGAQLSAIGNNINQIAHWANAQKSIYEHEIVDAAVLAKEAYKLVKESI